MAPPLQSTTLIASTTTPHNTGNGLTFRQLTKAEKYIAFTWNKLKTHFPELHPVATPFIFRRVDLPMMSWLLRHANDWKARWAWARLAFYTGHESVSETIRFSLRLETMFWEKRSPKGKVIIESMVDRLVAEDYYKTLLPEEQNRWADGKIIMPKGLGSRLRRRPNPTVEPEVEESL